MFDAQKFIERVRAVDPGRYDVRASEIAVICNANKGELFNAAVDAFLYGFLKGQRAEHKKYIKPRPKAYKNDTECMVHLLHARVDRMKDDETFIRKLHYYAKALENGPGWSGEGRKEAAQK